MTVEVATFINGFNAALPNGASDPITEGDNHIRLIKSAILATFPAIAGQVTATHADLSSLLNAATTGANGLNVVTQAATNNGTLAASTAQVQGAIGAAIAPLAPLLSPTFTGTPTAPTATAGTATGQLATTAFAAALNIVGTAAATASATASASTATNAAASAAISAGAVIWVTGSTYSVNARVISPSNGRVYMSLAAGVSNTDPASDTRWLLVTTSRVAVAITAATITAISGTHYVMTNAAQSTLTLPATPVTGSIVQVTFTNTRTDNIISRNGSALLTDSAGNPLFEDMTVDVLNRSVILEYAYNAWRFYLDSTAVASSAVVVTVTQATDAATTATTQAGLATTARTAIDNKYRGALAADPSTRPDSTANQVGDEYFSTAVNLLKRFNGSIWQASDISTANLAAPTGASLLGSTELTGGVSTVKTDAFRSPSKYGRVSAADLPRFMATIRGYRHDLQTPIQIVGFGSSVGVGATLPDAATQAPSPKFKDRLKAVFDPAGLYNIQVSNQSVNGSTVSDFNTAWSAMIAAGITTPTICVLAYGMNDQGVAIYNSGQTYEGFIYSLRLAVIKAKNAGADVVLMTTPHSSVVNYPSQFALPAGIPQVYPTSIAAPVAPSAIQPSAATSTVTADFVGEGISISVSHRALRINQAMRDIAKEVGCVLIDVERYWFEALQKYQISTGSASSAENTLFNAGEIVHPNLLGHQLSYHRGIEDFVYALGKQTAQSIKQIPQAGYSGINVPATYPASATWDIYPPYNDLTTKPVSVKAAIGALDGRGVKSYVETWWVDPATGDFRSPALRLTGVSTTNPSLALRNYNGEEAILEFVATYNIAAGGTVVYTLPDNKGGQLSIRCLHPGVALSQIYANEFTTHFATTTLGTARQIGAGTEFTVSFSGLVVTVTATYANSSFYIKCEAF